MINVPKHKQGNDSLCGPACVRIVMEFYGLKASEKQIAKRCNHTYELGCTTEDMKKAAESYGFTAIIKNNATFNDIRSWLNKGVPVIVDWFTGSSGLKLSKSEVPNGHSSIIVGIDKNEVTMYDTEIGDYRRLKKEDFMRVWFDYKKQKITSEKDNLVIRQLMVIYK
jgi:predicted double-glycine peptidase